MTFDPAIDTTVANGMALGAQMSVRWYQPAEDDVGIDTYATAADGVTPEYTKYSNRMYRISPTSTDFDKI